MERKRTSKKQFKIYVDYLKSNKILITGKLSPSNNPEDLEALWKSLTEELNSCGDGPIRDINAWKKVFTEWKGVCRKKARENKALSELETQLIELTGRGAVTGLDLGELGLAQSSNQASTSQPGTSTSYTVLSEEKENRDPEMETELTPPTERLQTPQTTTYSSVKNKRTKIKRTRTGDNLCQSYESSVNKLGEKMNDISLAILEIAKAINRYCDIVESNSENAFIIDQESII